MKHPTPVPAKPVLSVLIAIVVGLGIGLLAAVLLIILFWGPQPTWPLRAG